MLDGGQQCSALDGHENRPVHWPMIIIIRMLMQIIVAIYFNGAIGHVVMWNNCAV